MKACSISQYDALARILFGVPLSEPRIFSPGYFCMKNLLGDVWLAQDRKELSLASLADFPEIIDVVDYGKHEAREKEKWDTRSPIANLLNAPWPQHVISG